MSTAPVSRGVTALQVRDLTRRITAVAYTLRVAASSKAQLVEPQKVKAARRLANQFDAKNRKAMNAASDKATARLRAVEKLALFGNDMPKALAAVEALETEARNAR